MDIIRTEEIIDTKTVNNSTYKLVRRVENGVKMKVWIPEYLMRNEIGADFGIEIKPKVLSTDEKVYHLYHQLKKATAEETRAVQDQIVKLGLNELPKSRKSEINSMIIRMMQVYENEWKLCHAMVRKLRRYIQQEELIIQRHEQLTLLFYLQEEINLISKNAKKIEIENFVDMETLPFDFSYINFIVPGVGVTFPENPPFGCDCVGKKVCLSNNCCPEMFSRQPTYNEFGEVVVPPNFAIYECNKNCKCAKSCTNRVVQRGNNVKLTIFRTRNCQWGVRTSEFIKKDTFVIEYVGEVKKRENAAKKHFSDDVRRYLFDLDFSPEITKGLYSIDSSKKGNLSRFINSADHPNLNVYSVWINWADPHIYHVALFAARDIKADEEISFAKTNISGQFKGIILAENQGNDFPVAIKGKTQSFNGEGMENISVFKN